MTQLTLFNTQKVQENNWDRDTDRLYQYCPKCQCNVLSECLAIGRKSYSCLKCNWKKTAIKKV